MKSAYITYNLEYKDEIECYDGEEYNAFMNSFDKNGDAIDLTIFKESFYQSDVVPSDFIIKSVSIDKERKIGKWISVEDELPKSYNGMIILGYKDGFTVVMDMIVGDNKGWPGLIKFMYLPLRSE